MMSGDVSPTQRALCRKADGLDGESMRRSGEGSNIFHAQEWLARWRQEGPELAVVASLEPLPVFLLA